MKNELEQKAMQYLNENKQAFLKSYTAGIASSDEKSVFFTAGMSGVGKTELSAYLKEQMEYLLHIDTDEIRKFFEPVGYDGQNSDSLLVPIAPAWECIGVLR